VRDAGITDTARQVDGVAPRPTAGRVIVADVLRSGETRSPGRACTDTLDG
jgi:hypothetical protein